MNAGTMILLSGGLAVGCWVLAKIGHAVTTPDAWPPSWPSRRARRAARSGCSTASNPRAPAPGTVPGHCKGKAHKPEHLGIAGRRVLVSRKWSNKSLGDHRAERSAFVRQLLDRAGVQPGYAVDDGPFAWETTRPGDTDVPSRPVLLLHAIHQRQRWRADYGAALMTTGEPPDDRSATEEAAA